MPIRVAVPAGADGVQPVVRVQSVAQSGDQVQPGGRAVAHRDRHRPIELDHRRGVEVLQQLRASGISCDCDFVGRSMRAQMREANRQKARFALILGDNELAANKIAVKDMESGEQELMPMDEALIKMAAIHADETVARYFAGEAY